MLSDLTFLCRLPQLPSCDGSGGRARMVDAGAYNVNVIPSPAARQPAATWAVACYITAGGVGSSTRQGSCPRWLALCNPSQVPGDDEVERRLNVSALSPWCHQVVVGGGVWLGGLRQQSHTTDSHCTTCALGQTHRHLKASLCGRLRCRFKRPRRLRPAGVQPSPGLCSSQALSTIYRCFARPTPSASTRGR